MILLFLVDVSEYSGEDCLPLEPHSNIHWEIRPSKIYSNVFRPPSEYSGEHYLPLEPQ